MRCFRVGWRDSIQNNLAILVERQLLPIPIDQKCSKQSRHPSSSGISFSFIALNILVVLCCLSSDLVETTAFDLDCLFVTLVERRRFRNTTRVGLNSISTLLTNAHPQSTIRHQVIQIITKRVQSWHRNQECNNNNNNNNKWGIVRGMVNIEGILARLEMTGPGRMHQLEQQPQHPP